MITATRTITRVEMSEEERRQLQEDLSVGIDSILGNTCKRCTCCTNQRNAAIRLKNLVARLSAPNSDEGY